MTESNTIKQVKPAIIAKAWKNKDAKGLIPAQYILPEAMTFGQNESYILGDLSLRTDRNATIPIKVAAGEKLFFYSNNKREDHPEDPDYSVSVLLPVTEANAFIKNSKTGLEKWRAAQGVA